MKITRTVVTRIFKAHYSDGTVDEIKGRYSYAGAKTILKNMHKELDINTIEISQEYTKYSMDIEDFIKNATVVE